MEIFISRKIKFKNFFECQRNETLMNYWINFNTFPKKKNQEKVQSRWTSTLSMIRNYLLLYQKSCIIFLCQGKSISLVTCFAQTLKILINQKLENISPSSIVAKDILTRINNQLFKRFDMLDPAIKNENWLEQFLNIDENQNFHLSKKQLLKKFSGNVSLD